MSEIESTGRGLSGESPVTLSSSVAIIGIGCLFPKADSLEGYWSNICNKVDAITEVPPTHWRPEDYLDKDPKRPDHVYAARGGFLSPVSFPALEFGISPNVLEATDTTQLLGLMVAKQALEDAGYGGGKSFDRDRVSVILGVTGTLELVIPLGARLGHPIWRRALKEAGVEEGVANDVVQRIADSYVGWQEDSFPGLLGNVAAGRIANRLDLHGTNCVVDAACASSLGAVHLAMLELESGRSDMVLSGGLDTFNDIFMYTCFSKTPALSPTGNARPFDAKGDGTILGEGLGVVLLKRYADAVRDGDKVYAVIKSIGSSSDGKGNAIYAPSPAGQARALRRAYAQANVTPNTIELIEAHGTGTRAGDAAEVTALAEVYTHLPSGGPQPPEPWCALGSVKSQIGHTKAAAGVAGLIKAALALHHKVLPPTIKVDQPIEQAASASAPFYVNTEQRPWLPAMGHPRRAAVSSFGFGGSNFHCVLEEDARHAAKPDIDWDGNVQIVALSAGTRAELTTKLERWPKEISWEAMRVEAARSRATFHTDEARRLVMVVERDRSIEKVLAAARTLLDKQGEQPCASSPERVYLGLGSVIGKVGAIFPGQGSQYVGMLRDLACRFPQVQQVLAGANVAVKARRLDDYIYPHSLFRDEDRTRAEEALRSTDVAQPALGAVSLGAWRVFEHFGLRTDAIAGHSYGELVALCVAGCIDEAALHELSRERGRLMAGNPGDDRGAMLAVRATLAQVETILREDKLDLVIANKNAPQQCVLSGAKAAIEEAAAACERRGIQARRLPVSAAFHSLLVAGVRAPFQKAVAAVEFRPPTIPIFANSTAQPYPSDPQQARDLLAGQLAQPVEFVAEIDNMYRSGVRTFVEVGPANKLSGLIGAILEGRDHQVLAVDASSGKRSGMFDLACTLAPLAALGHAVQMSLWDEAFARRAQASPDKKPTLTVPICGANYVKARQESKNGASAAPRQRVAANPPSFSGAPKASASGTTKTRDPKTMPQPARQPEPAQHKPPLPATIPPAPVPAPTTIAPAPSGSLTQALQITQDNLLALQKLGEQTAQLHRQFLDGQDRMLHVFQNLLEQQQRLVQVSLGTSTPTPISLAAAPQMTYVPEAPVVRETMAPAAAPISRVADPSPVPAMPVPASPVAAIPVMTSPGPVATIPAPVSPPLAPAARNDEAGKILLQVVSEKTGYPAEMLELDMELDADLGIDSIKRVEIFSALQEKLPEAPAIKPEHLGTLRTLRHVVAFLGDSPGVVAPETPAVSSAATAAPSAHAPSTEHVTQVLLTVVSEKTGYPAEMLELDMELDADLGIDSIKRVEIFSALQERMPDAPAVKPEHLGTLRTLRQVAAFIAAGATQSAPASTPPAKTEPTRPTDGATPASGPDTSPWTSSIQRFELTQETLDDSTPRPSIALSEGADIWITEDGAGLSPCVAARLSVLGYRPRLVSLRDWQTVPRPESLGGLVIVASLRGDDAFLQEAFVLLQACAPALRRSAKRGAAVVATIARMDGCFGMGGFDGDVAQGGLAGLAKTAAHEWPEVHGKAIDLAASFTDNDEAALALVEELLLVGPAEVGITPYGRCTLRLDEAPLPPTDSAPPLQKGDVVIVTGGARGVTAACALALASAWSPTLILLGRSPEPKPEPDWLTCLTEENDVKRALLAHANGTPLSPKELGEQYRQVSANREVRLNLDRISATGASVLYRTVDIRDAAAVRAVIADVRDKVGPIRGLIHGAGVLADRLIEEKTAEQFERVYSTKVTGLRTLLQELAREELKVLVLFSSTTGRMGRAGQVDYAMANEVLNKLAQQEARRRPTCRVVSVNWGPWDGGMVTPALKKVFEQEGVGVIPLQTGAEYLVHEIAGGDAVEIVVMGRQAQGQRSLGDVSLALSFERDVDLESCPILHSHVLDGRAVLPMALTLEWLAHGALHGNPGFTFHGCDELRILKGVRLEEDRPRRIRVLAGKAQKQDGLYRVPVEMRGSGGAGRELLHARADILLADRPATADQRPAAALDLSPYPHDRDEIYQAFLFHGPELQAIERVEGCSADGIVATVATAPAPSAWITQPLRQNWLADPLALDAAFQMMILWSFANHQAGSLPCYAGKYRQYRRVFPRESIRITAKVTKNSPQRALADIEFRDQAGALIARMEDYECVIDTALNELFRNNVVAVR